MANNISTTIAQIKDMTFKLNMKDINKILALIHLQLKCKKKIML